MIYVFLLRALMNSVLQYKQTNLGLNRGAQTEKWIEYHGDFLNNFNVYQTMIIFWSVTSLKGHVHVYQ